MKNVRPETKKELRELILETINKEGNECDLNFIDTSLITDMSFLFQNMNNFNGKISDWDVSNVTDMHCMFNYARTFNQPLEKWNVSKLSNQNRFAGSECVYCGLFELLQIMQQLNRIF